MQNIKSHKITTERTINTSKGAVSVVRARFMVSEKDQWCYGCDTYISEKELDLHYNHKKCPGNKSVGVCFNSSSGRGFIIALYESVEKGDLFYHEPTDSIERLEGFEMSSGNKGYRCESGLWVYEVELKNKVIALEQHFSNDLHNEIADSKLICGTDIDVACVDCNILDDYWTEVKFPLEIHKVAFNWNDIAIEFHKAQYSNHTNGLLEFLEKNFNTPTRKI